MTPHLDSLVASQAVEDPVRTEYHHLKTAARWGKTAKTLILIGLVYNLAVLAVLVIYIRLHQS